MKIAIFGDSYANHKLSKNNVDQSWVDILKLKNYDITNFAEPGSSLYFSYDLFMKNHKNFDKIIFCVTTPNRIYLPKHSELTISNNRKSRHAKINSSKTLERTRGKNGILMFAIDLYYKHIHNEEKDSEFCNLMLNQMKNIRSDGLYFSLMYWSQKENEFYGITNDIKVDIRNCHLTQTNNVSVSKFIEDWLIGKNNDLDSYYRDPTEKFERYFER